MIFTDGIFIVSNESIDELRHFAETLGLSPSSYEADPFPRYRVPLQETPIRTFILNLGAAKVHPRELYDKAFKP